MRSGVQNMSYILNHLRTAPPPVPNSARPLLPGSPPPKHLPLNPIQYLTIAIDSVAPLLRIRSQKGAAGGGAALQIPVPLGVRQRRRQAVQWILVTVEWERSVRAEICGRNYQCRGREKLGVGSEGTGAQNRGIGQDKFELQQQEEEKHVLKLCRLLVHCIILYEKKPMHDIPSFQSLKISPLMLARR